MSKSELQWEAEADMTLRVVFSLQYSNPTLLSSPLEPSDEGGLAQAGMADLPYNPVSSMSMYM